MPSHDPGRASLPASRGGKGLEWRLTLPESCRTTYREASRLGDLAYRIKADPPSGDRGTDAGAVEGRTGARPGRADRDRALGCRRSMVAARAEVHRARDPVRTDRLGPSASIATRCAGAGGSGGAIRAGGLRGGRGPGRRGVGDLGGDPARLVAVRQRELAPGPLGAGTGPIRGSGRGPGTDEVPA